MERHWVFFVFTSYCMFAVHCDTKLRIATLNDELSVVGDIIRRQQMTLEQIKINIENTERNVKELSDYHKGKRQSSQAVPVIGFTAALSKSKTNLGNRQTLVYETVITNVHHGYNKTSGVFTCPVSGQYQFAASIISSGDNKILDAELVKNGIPLIHLSAHNMGYDDGSYVIMTHCNKNQQVWVRHLKTPHGSNYIRAARPAYFSGHLIMTD